MWPSTFRPKLRHPINIESHSLDGVSYLLFSCPLGLGEPLGLRAETQPLIALLDGQRTYEEISALLKENKIPDDILPSLLKLLDDNFFLETPRFFDRKAEVIQKFLDSPDRNPSCAGRVYSHDKENLTQELTRYLTHADSLSYPDSLKLEVLIAPHIDYRRGHICYGKTYAALKDAKPTRYILIGTAHQYSPLLFHLTKKNFLSPLGTLKADQDFISEISTQYGTERAFKDELLHRKEHSLELQIPFLLHFNSSPLIVPILVGSFYSMMQKGIYPEEDELYESFVDSLVTSIKKSDSRGEKTVFIAGVDMAHVGRQFGDEKDLNDQWLDEIKIRDAIYLEYLLKRDKRRFFDHIAEDSDQRRMCGFPTLYTILDVLGRLDRTTKNELFEYRQAVDHAAQCCVTFAGAGIYKESNVVDIPTN